jgi:pSer/pThr/pTyr-binding forkhead associated (FHA) protein
VSPFVLAVLKYAFLALVYFFVYRAIRAVAAEITGRRESRTTRSESRQVRAARGKKGPTVVVVRDPDGQKVGSHKLSSTLSIGRADACHIRVDDVYVSQFHARLFPKNGTWHIEDLGSTNGTYLNRQRVSGSAELQAGDQIRVGKTTLELRR